MAPKTERPPLAVVEDANPPKPQEETNMIEKTELKLEAIDTSKLNPFDPGRLASSVNISANLFTKEQIEMPVVKADKHRFFRVHPDLQFSTQISLLLYDGEFFCVDPSVAAALGAEANPYVLYLCRTARVTSSSGPSGYPRLTRPTGGGLQPIRLPRKRARNGCVACPRKPTSATR